MCDMYSGQLLRWWHVAACGVHVFEWFRFCGRPHYCLCRCHRELHRVRGRIVLRRWRGAGRRVHLCRWVQLRGGYNAVRGHLRVLRAVCGGSVVRRRCGAGGGVPLLGGLCINIAGVGVLHVRRLCGGRLLRWWPGAACGVHMQQRVLLAFRRRHELCRYWCDLRDLYGGQLLRGWRVATGCVHVFEWVFFACGRRDELRVSGRVVCRVHGG